MAQAIGTILGKAAAGSFVNHTQKLGANALKSFEGKAVNTMESIAQRGKQIAANTQAGILATGKTGGRPTKSRRKSFKRNLRKKSIKNRKNRKSRKY